MEEGKKEKVKEKKKIAPCSRHFFVMTFSFFQKKKSHNPTESQILCVPNFSNHRIENKTEQRTCIVSVHFIFFSHILERATIPVSCVFKPAFTDKKKVKRLNLNLIFFNTHRRMKIVGGSYFFMHSSISTSIRGTTGRKLRRGWLTYHQTIIPEITERMPSNKT